MLTTRCWRTQANGWTLILEVGRGCGLWGIRWRGSRCSFLSMHPHILPTISQSRLLVFSKSPKVYSLTGLKSRVLTWARKAFARAVPTACTIPFLGIHPRRVLSLLPQSSPFPFMHTYLFSGPKSPKELRIKEHSHCTSHICVWSPFSRALYFIFLFCLLYVI